MAFRVPMDLQKRLVDLGLVPEHCQQVELFIPAAGMLTLRYEIAVRNEHIAALAAFFTDYDKWNAEHNQARIVAAQAQHRHAAESSTPNAP